MFWLEFTTYSKNKLFKHQKRGKWEKTIQRGEKSYTCKHVCLTNVGGGGRYICDFLEIFMLSSTTKKFIKIHL